MAAIPSIMRSAQQSIGGVSRMSFDAGGKFERARSSPQKHKWNITGTVGAATRTDQTAFYNLLTDVVKSSTHDLVAAVAAVSGWTPATIARYIADNPSPLINIHFTGASTDALLGDGNIEFVRKTPDGNEVLQPEFLSTFRHDMQQQPKVLSVPVNSEVLDGYTYPRVLTAEATPTANSFSATFTFGATLDRRADVPLAEAGVVGAPR